MYMILASDIYDEDTTFTSADGTRAGLARISLGKQGQSEGYYSNRKGQLSDSKYIFDGEYYQEYSYEIRSSISPDKYKEMLKKVIHVAGTKSFPCAFASTQSKRLVAPSVAFCNRASSRKIEWGRFV